MDYMGKQFYDEGWNAYINGQAYSWINSKQAWRDGWKDCQEATAKYGKQQPI